jgi:hypothetical protein
MVLIPRSAVMGKHLTGLVRIAKAASAENILQRYAGSCIIRVIERDIRKIMQPEIRFAVTGSIGHAAR